MEGLLPRVEDFLVNFAGTNETAFGALTEGLVEVGEVVKCLLSRESQPNTTEGTSLMDPEVVLVLRREVESLGRATENLPQGNLKLKNEVQAWGGRVESTFVQLRANDAQKKEALGAGG